MPLKGIVFTGLTETNINKNNFLCPDVENPSGGQTNPSESYDCSQSTIDGASGFNLSGGKTLQFFNNQVYWDRQKALREQYLSKVDRYKNSEDIDIKNLQTLQEKMKSDGWGAMGGYCIIITTDPMTTYVAQPTKQPASGQVKLVVQLWYSGDLLLQLWSQDVALLSENQSFSVQVSSDEDTFFNIDVASIITSSIPLKTSFLSGLGFVEFNRKNSVYSIATQSPRSVKIVPA